MNRNELVPGMEVRVKTRKQLIDEFGTLSKVPGTFVDGAMNSFFGQTIKVPESYRNNTSDIFFVRLKNEEGTWGISAEMVEPTDDHKQQAKKRHDEFSAFFDSMMSSLEVN